MKMPKWKPVSLDGEGIFNNIEGLIGIEVLEENEAQVVRGKGNQSKKRKLDETEITKSKAEKILDLPDLKKIKKKTTIEAETTEIYSSKQPVNKKGKTEWIVTTEDVPTKRKAKKKTPELDTDSPQEKVKKKKKAKSKTDEDDVVVPKESYKRQSLEEGDDSFMSDMEAWRKHGLRREILKALHDKRFFTPTKIQQNCVHGAITSKKSDIVGAAETGSGKTFAYGIPIVQEILNQKENEGEDNDSGDLAAIIMTPTRELAVQVKEQLIHLCKYTKINVAMVVGGLAREKQERLLKRNPQIVVGTPGRLWELFNDGNPHLRKIPLVRMLVVDEADRMLEQKHFAELGELLERMNADPEVREGRRNFVFSATLTFVHDPPSYHQGKRKQPKQKLGELLSKIGVKNQLVYDLSQSKMTPETLAEWKVSCQFEEKDYYLVYFLQQNPGRAIIFCNSIGCVKRLANLLSILKLKPLPLHANMEQKQRLRNLEKFRDSSDGLLLATDVAARGLDIPNVGHVVHYQVPRTAESYVHRSGRTARQSESGATLLLVTVEDNRQYNKLMKSLKRENGVEDLEIEMDELDQVKKIVHLARDIDQAGLALRRTTTNEKWFSKAAEEMDIILDDDMLPEKTTDHAMKKQKKELSVKEKQLAQLLAAPVLPRGFSGKFPDMNLVKQPKKRRRIT